MTAVRRRQAPPPPEGCVWMKEAARRCGKTYNTLRKWRSSGLGPKGFKVGDRVAYKETDIQAWLEAQYDLADQPDPDAVHEARPPEIKPTATAHGRRTPAALTAP